MNLNIFCNKFVCFYREKNGKNSVRIDERGRCNSAKPNMKTELHLKCSISRSYLYSTTKSKMAETYIKSGIHKRIINMSCTK